MKLLVVLFLFTCVSAQLQEHDCEHEPLVINKYKNIDCKDIVFRENFKEHMMSSTCANPRDTIVPIMSNEPDIVYIPHAVAVKRCGGVCFNNLSCMPKETKMVPFKIRRHKVGGGGTTCATVEVEEHVRCKCDCRVKESHCHPDKQVYEKSECMCKCLNKEKIEECERDDKLWEQRTCSCKCKKQEEECTTGLYWVPSLCRCMKMMDENNEVK